MQLSDIIYVPGFVRQESLKDLLFSLLILLSSCCSTSAQNNNESFKHEMVYLHTDRNIYLAGDNLFYTLYLRGNPGKMSKYAYLIIRNKNNAFVSDIRLEINNQIAFGSISLPDTLSSAIYQIVCYTNCMRNEGEKTYFNKEIFIANRFDEKMDLFSSPINDGSHISTGLNSGITRLDENLIIQLDKKVYFQREKISFSIESNNIPDDAIARLSVSISEIIPGIPEERSISEYFENNNKSFYTGKPNQNHCSFLPEIYGPVLQGKIIPVAQSDKQKNPLETEISGTIRPYTLLVSAVDSVANLQFTATDSMGSFGFILNPYYDGKELIIRLKDNANSTIIPDDKFNLVHPFTPSGFYIVPGVKEYIIQSGKIVQVQKFYNQHIAVIKEKEFLSSKTIPRVYYKNYNTIFPSDFIELKDFVEISIEIVPAFKVRSLADKFVSVYLNLQDQAHINVEPTIFLDGVPIDDVNQIIRLGSNKIKRIESIPVKRFFGEMSFSGILAVFSKDLEINNIQFKTPAIKYQTLSSESYTKPEPFKPIFNNNHIPDLRQILLWEPEILLRKNEKQKIDCYASDLQGKYRINIQGITSNGYPVNGSAVFIVQSKSK
ncbi:MAG: hypothetical protein WCS03_17720 [Bacteroidota bacterium]